MYHLLFLYYTASIVSVFCIQNFENISTEHIFTLLNEVSTTDTKNFSANTHYKKKLPCLESSAYPLTLFAHVLDTNVRKCSSHKTQNDHDQVSATTYPLDSFIGNNNSYTVSSYNQSLSQNTTIQYKEKIGYMNISSSNTTFKTKPKTNDSVYDILTGKIENQCLIST
jgi:hypothetical protein